MYSVLINYANFPNPPTRTQTRTQDKKAFDKVKLGEVRTGTVSGLREGAVEVDIGGGIVGTIMDAHLSDHRPACPYLVPCLSCSPMPVLVH